MDITKRELIFLYESKYSIPNGDPFTGEQRYDEETKKALVSDVRIKRFIRDYLENNGETIFVSDKKLGTEKDKKNKAGKGASGASARYSAICEILKITENEPEKVLEKVIDLRLFGGIVTAEGNNLAFTGPVQFALLNPSLNQTDLKIHQNTTVFVSSTDNKQGSIGTTSVVPYSLNQIHGWVNPYSADETRLKEEDVTKMLDALWKSINLANTRSKSNQRSILLLSINYKNANDKLYGVDEAIELKTEKEEISIRSMEDYTLDFNKLFEIAKSDKVEEIEFFTEIKTIKEELSKISKFKLATYIS
jgi:CRISPR-associated protein Csh2